MNRWRIAATAAGAAAVAAAVWTITAPEERTPKGPGDFRRAQLRPPEDDTAGVCVLAPLGAAPVRGTLLFRPKGLEVEISGTVEGLPPGRYRFEIAEFGDARGVGSGSLGGFFLSHDPAVRLPVGDLSLADLMSFDVDASGVARLRQVNPALTLYGPDTLIGRALVVYGSAAPASEGGRVAFGIIGRSNAAWTPTFDGPLTGHGEGLGRSLLSPARAHVPCVPAVNGGSVA